MFSKATCPNCQKTVKQGDRYCAACGTALAGGHTICGACHNSIPANAQFCPHCGQSTQSTRRPQMESNRWVKSADDFATRVDGQDLEGLFRKHLIIEPGTRAVMLVDGASIGILPPGKYALEDLKQKLRYTFNFGTKKAYTALLIDDGPVDLQFDLAKLFTTDPLEIGFSLRLSLQLDEAQQATYAFMRALLKGQHRYQLTDLRQYLFPEIEAVARTWVNQHSIAALNQSQALKQALEQELEMALKQSLQRTGLQFLALRTFDFAHPRYDALAQKEAKYYLDLAELEAEGEQEPTLARKKLENRQKLFEVFSDVELQKLIEETAQVEQFEARTEIWARMRQAVLSDKMNAIRTEAELEAFLREQDQQKLISDEEMADLKRTYREAAEDHTTKRAFLQRKLEIERQKDLDRLSLENEQELLALRLQKRERELQAQLQEERIKAIERKQTDTELRQRELEIALKEAKTQADIERIGREQDKLDGELGVYLLELMDARKEKKARAQMVLEAERAEKALERRLRLEQAQHEQALARIQVLSQASSEVLISLTESDARAALLAELKQTELLKGMSEEQILAMAAENSPEVARAFQEKFRAMSSEQQALYERLLQEKDTAGGKLADALREAAKSQQDLAFKALDNQRDVAQAFAQGGGNIVVTPSGQAGSVAGGSQVQVCPQCRVNTAVGTKFCPNCGHQFFG